MVNFPDSRHIAERRTEARHPDTRRRATLPPAVRQARRGASVRGPNSVSTPGGALAPVGPTAARAHRFLDRVLELLERRRLSATELRVLLALYDRERTIADLAEELGRPPHATWRAGRALSARGLARWHHVGRRKRTTVGLSPAGLAAMRPLLTAAGEAAEARERVSAAETR
jgi:DNA-binding MarR family transcriptional regulator